MTLPTPEEQAIAAALAQAERDVACGIRPSAEILRVALHKAMDVIKATSGDRDAARTECDDHASYLRAEGYVRCDIAECNCGSWHPGGRSRLAAASDERDALRAEVTALRAQVAEAHQAGRVEMREEMQAWADDALEVMRSAAQMNERAATDAARKAERADVVAWLRSGGWLPERTWESVRNCFHQAADIISRGGHEGAATPK